MVPIARTSQISVQIDNGAGYVDCYFNSGYMPELSNGANTVNFDPDFDGAITFAPITGTPFPDGQKFFYSMTVNGVAKSPAYSYQNYVTIDPVNPGDRIVIKVFENGEPQINYCDITLQLPDNLAGCIKSIRDWTMGEFLDTSTNTWTVREGNDIAFNFNEDYNFTKFTFAGQDITDKFNADYNQLRFIVEQSGTLVVEGSPKDYGSVTFTAWIMNPEGVNLRAGEWDSEPIVLPEGTDVETDVELNGATLEAASSRKYQLDINGKNPYVYISPKEGWYIATVQAQDNNNMQIIQYADGDLGLNEFYVIAGKLDNTAKVNVEVQGNADMVFFRGNQSLSGMWDNPATTYELSDGSQTLSFTAGYDNPFNVRAYCDDAAATPQIFVDGANLVPDDNGIFSVAPYIQPDTQNPTILSDVVINNSSAALKTYTVKYTATDIEAALFYGTPHTQTSGKSVKLLGGTKCYFRPASPACLITVNNEVVHGTDADGNFINGLNADGEYVFTVAEKNVTIDVVGADIPDYTLSPAADTDVIGLSKVTVTFNKASSVEYADKMIDLTGPDFATTTNGVYLDGNMAEILFNDMPSAAGDYHLTIPAGTFLLDGADSPLIEADYHYAPPYALFPASGSVIESADEFTISFPSATNVAFTGSQWSILLSQGNKYTSPGMICEKIDGDVPTFRISLPEGANQPPLGPLTLYFEEECFSIDGMPSPAIKANYTLDHEISLDWTVSPENYLMITDYGMMWAFIFDQSATVSLKSPDNIHVYLDGTDITSSLDEYGMMTEGNQLLMMLSDTSMVEEGMTLKVTIDAGALLISGTDCPAIEYQWTVVAPKEYAVVLDPADNETVNDLSTITISFPEAETGIVFNEYGFGMRSSDYSYNVTPTVEAVEDVEHPTFKLTFSPAPVNDGSYILTLYRGAITLDGIQESPYLTATYNFISQSGIAGFLFDPDQNVTVVSVDGNVLYKNVKAADVKNLGKGIYIINGKRVFVK